MIHDLGAAIYVIVALDGFDSLVFFDAISLGI